MVQSLKEFLLGFFLVQSLEVVGLIEDILQLELTFEFFDFGFEKGFFGVHLVEVAVQMLYLLILFLELLEQFFKLVFLAFLLLLQLVLLLSLPLLLPQAFLLQKQLVLKR